MNYARIAFFLNGISISLLIAMQGNISLPDSCATGCTSTTCTMVFSFGGMGDGTLGGEAGNISGGGVSGNGHPGIPTGIGFGTDPILAAYNRARYVKQLQSMNFEFNNNANYIRLNTYLLQQLTPFFLGMSEEDIKTTILAPTYRKADQMGRMLRPPSGQDPLGVNGMRLGYELSKEMVYAQSLHAQAEHAMSRNRLIGELLVSFAHNMQQALEGCGTGVYQTFETYAELLVAIWNNPAMVSGIPEHVMNILTDPGTSRDTIKNFKEHIQHMLYRNGRIIAQGNAQEKGALFCGFAADSLLILAGGEAAGVGQDALKNLARLARSRNAHTLGQQLYERLRSLPSVAQAEFREQLALRLAARNRAHPGRIINPGEAAEAYIDLIERSLRDFSAAEGILEPSSPLVKIIDALEKSFEKQTNIPGYVFELETAQYLKQNGYEVQTMGLKYKSGSHPLREFDLTVEKDVQTTLVECKVSLPIGDKFRDKSSKIKQQKLIATGLGFQFEVVTKTPVPLEWQAFFREEGISYREILIPSN